MTFNPDLFRWARLSAGLELEGAARAIGVIPRSLAEFENGNKEPSRATLSKMAKVYRRSLLTFYLPTPPSNGDRGEDFRTVTADRTVEADADIDALVRDLRVRQQLVRAVLLDDEDVKPLEFVGSVRFEVGVETLTGLIERQLGMTRAHYRAQKDAGSAFAFLRQRVEQVGVFVLLIGNLGSHHSAIPVEAFRGFAIADSSAPFIAINDGDAKAAWSFTLLHELAHLWLGATGVSGGGAPEKIIERFCNEVAGEFLFPRSEAVEINLEEMEVNKQVELISDRALDLRVSRQLVAYGLFKAGRIPFDVWKLLDAELRKRWIAERTREKDRSNNSNGPSYYVVRRHRLGNAMLEFARRYTDAGELSPAKAAKVLGVKPRSVSPLLAISA
jgi:Zn-dependent peptidase ImmA (M78 family)/transcriptional regulator with XRE-family HTH domain